MQVDAEGHEFCCAVHGYMLILICSICATERCSIAGYSKKYAVWIWSICLTSFVFCVTFLFGQVKKTFQCQKNTRTEQSRAPDWPALGLGLDKGMQFHLYHWQKHYGHSQHSFLFLFRLHILKREKKINQLTIASKLWMNQSWNYPWSTSEALEKEAAWIMWLHFLLLPFFQSFIIGKSLYFHHTVMVLWCTEAKW